MTIDKRLQALRKSVELVAGLHRDSDQRSEAKWEQIAQARHQNGEHIRALARIAEIHERRLTHLEGEE